MPRERNCLQLCTSKCYRAGGTSANHGPHNMLNLIEGNVFHWYKDDGYFGSSSHNTLFRNGIFGIKLL